MKQLRLMKKFLSRHKNTLIISLLMIVWRVYLFILEQSRFIIPTKSGYLGPIFQANFDGVYYLAISEFWYRGLDQAFFPLYPIAIHVVVLVSSLQPFISALIVSVLSLFFLLKILSQIMAIDGYKKYTYWAIIIYLSLPASFFFAAVYTESFFVLLTLLSFYLARKKRLIMSGIVASLATATRIVGIFLLPALFLEYFLLFKENKKKLSRIKILFHFLPLIIVPFGLFSYMLYLWHRYSDPIMFVHIQPAFGAGRSGGNIVFLPQVLFRYVKIFMTISPTSLTFFVAVLEIVSLLFGTIILFLAYKKGIRKSYLLFSFCAIYFPTLSGTLSSLPRYMLVCFAVVIYLAAVKNRFIKIGTIIVGLVLQGVLAILFLQGYFVS